MAVNCLLIEDNIGDARFVELLFAKAPAENDFTCHHVKTLSDALSCLETEQFDCILADLSLPDSVGIETVTLTQKVAKDIPIVVLSGTDDEHVAISAVQHGAQDYLVKGSINSEILVRVVRYAIERRKINRKLAWAEKLESVGILAGGIAHDFNNLLTAMLGNIELAKIYSQTNTKVYQLLHEAENAGKHARTLTSELLTFSRGGAPVKKPVSIKTLFLEVEATISRGSFGTACFNVDDEIDTVMIDMPQMVQVLKHIITNAAEATKCQGCIAIKAVPCNEKTSVKISIADTGPGIEEAILHKIFDPYFSTSKDKHGLGLAVVYSIVQQHGGTINVDSEPGVGTQFDIILPMTDIIDESQKETQQKHILLVEDDPASSELCAQLLQELGYAMDLARTTNDAVRCCEKAAEAQQPYAAVIMDLKASQREDGAAALPDLRACDSELKMLVTSQHPFDPINVDFEALGYDGVVAKPFVINQIDKVLRQLNDAAK